MMKKYIRKRLIQLIFVIWCITVLTFIMTRISSVDAVDIYEQNTGIVLSDEQKYIMKEQLGLNQPLIQQYVSWISGLIQGDWGRSYVSDQPVLTQFMDKLPATMALSAVTVVVTLVLSLPLGICSAVFYNRWFDYIIRLSTFAGNSLPLFFVALLSIYIFSLKLHLLPVISQSMVLPVFTLAIPMVSKYTRQIRTMVLEEMNQEYVQAAKARGVQDLHILIFYVLKAILPLIVTLVALSIGSLLGGSAIIESIFMWDGVGKMAIDAIMMKDFPVIQAYVIYMSVVYVLINLAADLMNCYLQPRMRWEERS